MASERLNRIPCLVGPFVCRLKVPSCITTVDLKSDVVVDVTGVADVVDGDRHFGYCYVFSGLCRLRKWMTMEIRGELVCCNIQFRVWRQLVSFLRSSWCPFIHWALGDPISSL